MRIVDNSVRQVTILTFIPIILFVLFFFYISLQSYQKIDEFNQLKRKVDQINDISSLVTELQKERGLSSAYLGSNGVLFTKELKNQYDITDKALISCMNICIQKKSVYRDIMQKIHQLRKSIIRKNILPDQEFLRYTDTISLILMDYRKLVHTIKDYDIKMLLDSYTPLVFMKESLGEIRGTINAILSSKSLPKVLIKKINYAEGMFNLAKNRFLSTSAEEDRKNLQAILQTDRYQFVKHVLHDYKVNQHYSPKRWYDIATSVIQEFISLQQKYLLRITELINKKLNQIIMNIGFLFFIFMIVVFFLAKIGFKLKSDILRNLKLLREYRDAVDRSSIVSKTDKSGRITYVNEQFCKISGYTRDELVGKPHNIVRDPEMPKSAFSEMWKTILAKQSWSGIISNQKKDGSIYIVEVTINPILNHKGEIEEFIAIRNDITDRVKLKKELDDTQREFIYRMGEIGETRSEETGFHVKRVAKYSELLARYYGLSESEIKNLTYASPMHDIGKVAIPDAILKKPGALTQKEWEIMKTHAQIGYKLFCHSEKPLLQAAAIVAHEHHEKYDGSGYPQGLKGDKIHIFGRITAVADVFDALSNERVYKKAWSDEKIFALLKEERGKHFDPKLIDIFFEHLDEFIAIRDRYQDR